MTDQTAIGPADLVPVLQRVELTAVHVLDLHASRIGSGHPVHAALALESGMAAGVNGIDYKFDIACTLAAEDESPVAELRASILLHYTLQDGPVLSEAVLNTFGNVISTPAAFPYLRQHLQDMASRIGIPGFTLGLLKPTEQFQVSVSINLPVWS